MGEYAELHSGYTGDEKNSIDKRGSKRKKAKVSEDETKIVVCPHCDESHTVINSLKYFSKANQKLAKKNADLQDQIESFEGLLEDIGSTLKDWGITINE